MGRVTPWNALNICEPEYRVSSYSYNDRRLRPMSPGFSSVSSLIISDLDMSSKERHPPRALIWSVFVTHEKDYKMICWGRAVARTRFQGPAFCNVFVV